MRQRVRTVLDWAVAMEMRLDNPCDGVLDAARSLGDGDLVFPMRSGRPIAPSTRPQMLKHHGIAAVAHGFRSSFRDWAAEAALVHVVPDKVEAAYARSDLFERRRLLMDDWRRLPRRRALTVTSGVYFRA